MFRKVQIMNDIFSGRAAGSLFHLFQMNTFDKVTKLNSEHYDYFISRNSNWKILESMLLVACWHSISFISVFFWMFDIFPILYLIDFSASIRFGEPLLSKSKCMSVWFWVVVCAFHLIFAFKIQTISTNFVVSVNYSLNI